MSLFPLKNLWIRRNFAFGIALLIALFSMLVTSLTHLRYTAYAQIQLTPASKSKSIDTIDDISSDYDTFAHIKSNEEALIRSSDTIKTVIRQRKLATHPFMNSAYDDGYALSDKFVDAIYNWLDGGKHASLPIEDQLYQAINNNIKITFTEDYVMTLQYEGPSPHLAHDITALTAKRYVSYKTPGLDKKIITKPEIPVFFTTPNLKNALYCTAVLAFICATIGALYIKPRHSNHIRE